MDIRELVAHLGLEVDEHSFERGREAIEGLHLGFKAFSVAAGAAVAGALVHFTRETAEAADAAGKLAQSTGLNSEFLQKLSYAADLADVSTESLAVGLRHLAKTGVKDVQGEVLKLADQFAVMPNDGAKVELAMKKFGRAGAQLIPIFKDGSKGITELMQEAEDLGLVFSEEDSKAAEEFNDDSKRLSKSLTGLRNDIGRVLIPVLHSLVNGFRTFMREVRGAMPSLKAFTVTLRVGLALAIGAATVALIANASAIVTAIGWYAALSIASVRAALSAAVAWASAAAPFVILAAIVAVLYLALEDLYYFLTGGKSVIGDLKDDFEKFLFEFTKPHAGDPWFIKMLRFAVELISGIQQSTNSMLSSLQQIPGFGGATVADLQDPYALINRQLGGGASPAAAAAVSNSSTSSRSVTINSPVTINGAGGSPKDIAEQVGRVLEEQTAKAHRAAIGGIP